MKTLLAVARRSCVKGETLESFPSKMLLPRGDITESIGDYGLVLGVRQSAGSKPLNLSNLALFLIFSLPHALMHLLKHCRACNE